MVADALRAKFVNEQGLAALLHTLQKKDADVIQAGAPLLLVIAQQGISSFEGTDIIPTLISLLEFPDRSGILVSFTLLPLLLENNGMR